MNNLSSFLKARVCVLEHIIEGGDVLDTLDLLCRETEEIDPTMHCSVLSYNKIENRLHHVAAPSLPKAYCDAIDGLDVKYGVGSCGTSAFTGERVIVENVFESPHWAPYHDIIKIGGFKACWSQPILSKNKEILGTFAMYYDTVRTPTEQELQLIQAQANLASLAIERKRDEEHLLQAIQDSEKANRAKSEFLSSMSHELRTPLNAIIGFAQVLQLNPVTPLDAKQKEAVRQIIKGGEHLLDLINAVLNLATIESGGLDLTMTTINLKDVVHNCISMINPMAEPLGISIQLIDFKDHVVMADIVRLRQVILNLLSNAVKYNHQGGWVKISSTITDDEKCRLAITDSGKGIPLHKQDELFHPFSRLGAENSTIEGSGIGLTITKRLVEAMEGTVGCESTPDVGSTFWVDLPLASEATKIEQNPKNTQAPKCSDAHHANTQPP